MIAPSLRSKEAVFVDLDRTYLRRASGPVFGKALRDMGLVADRPAFPGERLAYEFYDLFGESIPFIALARSVARVAKGWSVDAMREAGERAAPELMKLVAPYAQGVIDAHREKGRRIVLATTSPLELVTPFARASGFDDVIATRYEEKDGLCTGRLDGEFVWANGKLSAARKWTESNEITLRCCHAYSDSVFDLPLLGAVGHPHAVNPDPRLWVFASARRWPIEYWDRPRGVPKVAGAEVYHLLRLIVRPQAFPYARFDIQGVEFIPESGPVLIASNHRSYFDVAALALVAAKLDRPVRFLGKKELFDAPVVGQLARALGGISVDRSAHPERALRQAKRALDAGEVVVILPQGTIPRGDDFFDPVLHGRTGTARLAAMTGAPVIPVGLWGTEQVWPRASRVPNMLNLLHPPKVQVRVGRPMPPGSDDPVKRTEEIMEAISALLPDTEPSGPSVRGTDSG